MFCEKCGKQLNDNDKFCEGCGSPVAQVVENAAPVANEAPQAPVVNENVQPQQAFQANPAQITPVAPAQPKVKKPLPKNVKLGIIIGAAVAAVTVLVVCVFAFILPMFNKADVSKHVVVEFYDDEVIYDGYAEAYVYIDEEMLLDEILGNEQKDDSDYLSDLENGDYSSLFDMGDSYSKYSALDSLLDYCYVNAEIKDAEKETTADEDSKSEDDEDEDEDEDSYDKENYDYVYNISKDDVIVVNITWSEKERDIKRIEKYEKELGISFDRSAKSVEFKVSDIIEEEDLEFKDTVSVDVLGYIKDNNLTEVSNLKDGELEFKIKPFEFEAEGYTFKYEGSYDIEVYVDGDYEDYLSLYMTTADDSGYYYIDDLSNGDVVTVSIEQDNFVNEGTFVATKSVDFTVEGPTAITLDEAKTNIETIKTTAKTAIEEDSSYYQNVDVVEAYYLAPKADDAKAVNYVVVYAKCKYDGYFSDYDTYYIAYVFQDCFMEDGEFKYSAMGYSTSDQKLENLKKYDAYVKSTDYTPTAIM